MADALLDFYRTLRFPEDLPPGIRLLDPFQERLAQDLVAQFYRKFYGDRRPRRLLLGINPGRFGGGVTGIPFTDTKRLREVCGIPSPGRDTHEPSSVFVYEVIQAYGGPEAFYGAFLIHPLSPLGFVREKSPGRVVNYNYYDDPALLAASWPFIHQCLKRVLELGIERDRAWCLGTGKNYQILQRVNAEGRYFDRIIPLEHPRFVIQYRTKRLPEYVAKYLAALRP